MVFEDNRNVDERRVFHCIWKSLAPSKVVAFSWKLFLDRIPMRVDLQRRNILPPYFRQLSVSINLMEYSIPRKPVNTRASETVATKA